MVEALAHSRNPTTSILLSRLCPEGQVKDFDVILKLSGNSDFSRGPKGGPSFLAQGFGLLGRQPGFHEALLAGRGEGKG